MCAQQQVCLSGTASAAGAALSHWQHCRPTTMFLCHIFQRDQIIQIIQRQTHQIKSSMQKDRCAWSMHTACKDTPTHSYGVHLEQHPHLVGNPRPKYDLSHITHHNQNAEPVHSSGQAAAGRPLASRAPRLLPPYLLLYAGSGGGGGGGGSSKIRGRDRLLAAPTLE